MVLADAVTMVVVGAGAACATAAETTNHSKAATMLARAIENSRWDLGFEAGKEA